MMMCGIAALRPLQLPNFERERGRNGLRLPRVCPLPVSRVLLCETPSDRSPPPCHLFPGNRINWCHGVPLAVSSWRPLRDNQGNFLRILIFLTVGTRFRVPRKPPGITVAARSDEIPRVKGAIASRLRVPPGQIRAGHLPASFVLHFLSRRRRFSPLLRN